MGFLWILTSYLLLSCMVHSETAPLFRKCRNAFEWTNDTAKVFDSQATGNDLTVGDFRNNTAYIKLSNYKVFLFGDSLDLHSCLYLDSLNSTGIALFHKGAKLYPVNCYRDEHMDFRFYRFGGIVNFTGGIEDDASFVGKIATYKPDAIVFSSFAWDLLNSQKHYCAQGTNTESCLCHHDKMRLPGCIDVSNPHEYNRALTPWCDHTFLTTWRAALLKIVHELGSAFPNTKIYVRTQPFGSTLFLGNQACQGAMNNIIQEIGDSLLPLDHVGKGCRTLNMNALFTQVAHQYMGYGSPEKKARHDGLHYYHVANVWSNYMLNTIFDNALD